MTLLIGKIVFVSAMAQTIHDALYYAATGYIKPRRDSVGIVISESTYRFNYVGGSVNAVNVITSLGSTLAVNPNNLIRIEWENQIHS